MKTTSWGTLHVRTIQDLKYIIIISLTRLMSTRPGEKNMPIHTCPWLLINVRMFSAILKSPYCRMSTHQEHRKCKGKNKACH